MYALAASITLFLTILISLVFGIAAGYVAVWGILHAFGGRTRPQPRPAPAAMHAGD